MSIYRFGKFLENLEPLDSFKLKDELNPKIWDNFEINEEIREQLIQIGKDFFESTKVDAEIEDIILIGSLANYNWSEKYSDYDVHIVVDFDKINDDREFVEQYFKYAKKMWNWLHDIYIEGYEVEVYIQDINHESESNGQFSLMKNEWISKPDKVEFTPNKELIKEKASSVMDLIDELEYEVDKEDYEVFEKNLKKVWEKIKDFRKSGLESQGGEYSTGNLVFKLLRRNGYISKIMKLKRISYDKQFK
jgi:hypothetical protein